MINVDRFEQALADQPGASASGPAGVPGARVLRGQSTAPDALEAAREFHAAVAQPGMALVMFFCSAHYDLDVLAAELRRLFEDIQVIGCTTAGEIGPSGYLDRGLTGASFPASNFASTSGRIDRLQQFGFAQAQTLTQELMQILEYQEPQANADNCFALLLADGLSMREEQITHAFQRVLGEIPLVGGSAGDGLAFGSTHVYSDGAFHLDSAVLVLITTPLAFTAFRTQHFVPTDQRVVVTAADAEHRIVREIDGEPAVEVYARLAGVRANELDPFHFAEQPMVVVIDGTNYVRSIQKSNPDGSLTLFCAIEEGLVLRVARGVDLVENLEETFAHVRSEIGRPQVILGFDCILRKLEITQHGLVPRVEKILRENNVVGFNSYGEQYRGVHVNQTLTGIAIGEVFRDGV